MNIERTNIKPELHPKLVFIQNLADKYFDDIMLKYGLSDRKDFFAGHEFNIQYSNDYLMCNTWTECDNFSIQFIDLYRIDNSKNIRIDLWGLKESALIKDLYSESSKETEPLSTTFIEKFLKKEDEFDILIKPLKEYYDSKGAEVIEKNFQLHLELFRQHPELFKKKFNVKQTGINKGKIRVETNGKVNLKLSNDLTFREKLKKYLGI